jgi:hypothetical protein
MLQNLQHPSFRAAVASESIVSLIHQKEFYHWSHWIKNHPLPTPESAQLANDQDANVNEALKTNNVNQAILDFLDLRRKEREEQIATK